MKHLYWLIPFALFAVILVVLRQWDSPQAHKAQAAESSGAATSAGKSEFRVPAIAEVAAWSRQSRVAHTPLGKDRRRVVGEAVRVGKRTSRHEVPAIFTVFDEWMGGHLAASVSERPARLEEGRALLAERQKLWPDLARSDPEAALLFAPSPAARAVLPPDMAAQLEQIVSGEGFYGVKAICNHDPAAEHGAGCRIEHEVFIDGRSYQASIYGSRNQRLTEESASIYGVALDGLLALHEDDVVILPADAGQLALIYCGKTTLVPETHLEVAIHSLLNP
jgi:hypothetical protein